MYNIYSHNQNLNTMDDYKKKLMAIIFLDDFFNGKFFSE